MSQPKVLEWDELEAVLARARSAPLTDEDHQTLHALAATLESLTQELAKKRTSLKRLRALLFGPSSEKSADVLKKKRPSEQETSPPPTGKDKKKKKRKGHGRNGAANYSGTELIQVPHPSLKSGDACPESDCTGKVYAQRDPGVIVRIQGRPPLGGTVYQLDKLRCALCGTVFTAPAPEGIGETKYDETAVTSLTQELAKKRTSLKRLRALLFGPSSEKSADVLKKKRPSEQETSPPPTGKDKKKKKRKGHGRNGAANYSGTELIQVPHPSLKSGDACPESDCTGKVYAQRDPGVIVRIQGRPPLGGTVYQLDKLRCALCGTVFTAPAPEGIGETKYDETAASMVANERAYTPRGSSQSAGSIALRCSSPVATMPAKIWHAYWPCARPIRRHRSRCAMLSHATCPRSSRRSSAIV